MHLRVVEIAGGFYHTVVLLRQRNQEILSEGSSLLNAKDYRAYHNQYNMNAYVHNYLISKDKLSKHNKSFEDYKIFDNKLNEFKLARTSKIVF